MTKCDSQINNVSLALEFVRYANSHAPPGPTESETELQIVTETCLSAHRAISDGPTPKPLQLTPSSCQPRRIERAGTSKWNLLDKISLSENESEKHFTGMQTDPFMRLSPPAKPHSSGGI